MIQKSYSVYDEKACYFMPPFYCKTDAEAIRLFGFAVNDPQSSLSQIPYDISLYRIGEFDDSNGFFETEKPVPIGRGSEAVSIVSGRIPCNSDEKEYKPDDEVL